MTHDPLEIRQLVARYGEREILSGVDVNVRAGTVHVILGGSGSGKSTLLKHAVGLLQPSAGAVRLLGTDLAAADEPQYEALMGRVGMLFQGGALLNSYTVHENVALPLHEKTTLSPSVIDDVVRMKLAMVGLGHAAELAPRELSGGMRKRAALARAMALDPDILFCDEPSAGLDPVSAAELDELIVGLRDRFGTTIVVVTHELASIHAIADHVTMLARGVVVADGPLSEVARSQVPEVRAFFERRPDGVRAARSSVMSVLAGGTPP